MPDFLKTLLEYAIGYFQQAFAEVSIVLFTVGTLLLLLGIFTLVVTIYIRVVAYRISGTVVGAIKERSTKEKTRKGRTVQKTSDFYYAVFQYQRLDGALHQEKASEGGNHVLQYRTGQSVNLLVVPATGYDDVYDADQKTNYYLGGFLFLLGTVLMVKAANLYAALGISLPALLVAMLGLMLRTRRRKRIPTKPAAKHFKTIDPSAIRPIEEFVAAK